MSDYAGYGTIEGVVNAFGGSILQYMWMPMMTEQYPMSQHHRKLEMLLRSWQLCTSRLINEEFGVSDTDAT